MEFHFRVKYLQLSMANVWIKIKHIWDERCFLMMVQLIGF